MTLTQPKPVLSIGEILVDLIAADGATDLEHASKFVLLPGGAPANAAAALVRQGVPAAFCGVVGDDPFGNRLLSTLDAESVDRSRVRSARGVGTTIAFAWKDRRGDGHFHLLRMADLLLDERDVAGAGIEELGALVAGSVSLAEEPSRSAVLLAIDTALRHGVPVCIDVNMRPAIWPDQAAARQASDALLERATLVKLSLDDARFLLGESIGPDDVFRALSRFPARYVVLTDGERGAWFANRSDAPEFVPAFEIDSIEPTGAGDAFTAAIIARLIASGWNDLVRDDVVYAAAAGALTTTQPGAMESLPTRPAIESFLVSVRQP